MKRVVALLAAAATGLACAQQPCPHAGEVQQADMLGLWRAEVQGLGHVGTLLLQKHALDAEGFSGWINRDGDRRQVAGDAEDGEFTLEESADGVHIAANWVGAVVEGSCGREARGVWTIDGQETGRPFVLRKD